MTTATVLGIVSILIAFALFGASFYMATKDRKKESIIYGAVAFVFMTIIPVSLALFVAVPNPT